MRTTIVAHFMLIYFWIDKQLVVLVQRSRSTLVHTHDHVVSAPLSISFLHFSALFTNNIYTIYRADFGRHKIPPPAFVVPKNLFLRQFIVDKIPQLLCFRRLLYATLLKYVAQQWQIQCFENFILFMVAALFDKSCISSIWVHFQLM